MRRGQLEREVERYNTVMTMKMAILGASLVPFRITMETHRWGCVYKNISRKAENSGKGAPWMWTALSIGWGPRLNKDKNMHWAPAFISLCLLTRDASHSCGRDLLHHDALFSNCKPTQTCFVKWLLLGVLSQKSDGEIIYLQIGQTERLNDSDSLM